MAFQSVPGYGQLQGGVWSPVIYSKNVQKQFRKKSVALDVVNSDYFGELSNFGDSVVIIKEPEININALARGQQLTSQDLSDESFTLIIDRANYFQFQVDDIEKKMSHVNWESLASNRAAYRLADTYDRDILGYMSGYEYTASAGTWAARTTAVGTKAESTADAEELLGIHKLTRATFVSGGSASDSIAVGTSGTYDTTPLALLSRMSTLLDLQNVDKEGRYVIVDPVFEEILRDENSKFMDRDFQDGQAMTNGKITSNKVRGFELYSSNNLPYIGTGPGTADNNGSSANYGVIIAGQRAAVASAEQISKTESFRSQDAFADVVRGMHLYGRKILRPQALLRAIYNRAA
jgi:hypothetical protein